ncbi:MAG: PorT family protein, partial [Bacteroides sp.]|nr:PorT family protein [Bacteroides sp.]
MKMKWIACLLLGMTALGSQAQQNQTSILKRVRQKGWELDLKAGINIGGFSPLPLPVEIRSIDSYNPTLAV